MKRKERLGNQRAEEKVEHEKDSIMATSIRPLHAPILTRIVLLIALRQAQDKV